MTIDYQTLIGDCQLLENVFLLVKDQIGDQTSQEQAKIISLICAKRDQIGWYTPVGQELLTILLDYFDDALVSIEDGEVGVDLGTLADQIADRVEPRLFCLSQEPYPTKADRTNGAELS